MMSSRAEHREKKKKLIPLERTMLNSRPQLPSRIFSSSSSDSNPCNQCITHPPMDHDHPLAYVYVRSTDLPNSKLRSG